MGFKKSDIVREVTATVVYEGLYFERDESGKPVLDKLGRRIPKEFKYTFAVSRKADVDLDAAEQALGGGKKFSDVEKLARLLVKEPEGFEEFPMDERPLADRVREFFADMEGWASDALAARWSRIYPSQLFPGD